jgi:tripartite-type tricarboxylate transporter receptor subunit TctC
MKSNDRAAPAASRRAWVAAVACAAATLAIAPLAASAQAWPARPIRLVVPFAPGGVTDTSARVVADFLGRRLGQQVIVDNKPGASGNIGMALAKDAAPDGYTLVLAFDGTMVINPHVFAKVPFDTLKDYTPIGKIGNATLILVANPNAAVKSVADLVAVSKSTPGGLSFGTSGTGGTPHVAGELLKMRTGANLTHVPYKGGGPALIDVVGGSIPLVFTAVAGAHGFVKDGKVRALAVSSARRSASLPDVPTFVESGFADFVVDSWVGLLAPANLPAPIAARLNQELNAVLADPEARDKLRTLGIEATPGGAAEFRDEMARDLARYAQVVKAAGIKVE